MAVVFVYFNAFLLNFVADQVDVAWVLGHVCSQDHTYDAFTEHFLFICIQHINEIILWLQKDLHAFGSVPVLLNCLVMESESSLRHEVDVIGVIEAIVGEVVTGGGCDCRYQIKVAELGDLS